MKLLQYFLLRKMIVVQKSRFQFSKMLKMNIMKNSRNKYRTENSFNIKIR